VRGTGIGGTLPGMRISSVLIAAASACVLAGSLTACSGPSSGPGDSAAVPASSSSTVPAAGSALDLVGTIWRVEERRGTTVRFDGLAVTVTEGGRSSSSAWSAQGDEVLVGATSSALLGPVGTWLTSTTRVQRTAAGWTLLDASGAPTAHLTPAGTADSTTVTALLGRATPGDGVVDAPANALEGRWTAAGDLRSWITFASGTWRATSSCTSGAVGGAGVYRVLPGGRLLVTRTLTPIRGCPVVDGPVLGQATAITAIARAASFRVRGDTLTLFDRSGTVLGSLTRG
jgi:hypothetical protein